MVKALEIDSTFALAASDAACAFSFAKEYDRESVYFALALRHAGDNLRSGMSKGALIFQGNDAWLSEPPRPADAQAHYETIVRLYPDDPDGYYYTGMVHTYLQPDYAAGGDKDEELLKADCVLRECRPARSMVLPHLFRLGRCHQATARLTSGG
jgi:hypothetical protein